MADVVEGQGRLDLTTGLSNAGAALTWSSAVGVDLSVAP